VTFFIARKSILGYTLGSVFRATSVSTSTDNYGCKLPRVKMSVLTNYNMYSSILAGDVYKKDIHYISIMPI